MQIIERYNLGSAGQRRRAAREAELFQQGYQVVCEEQIKEWEAGKSCCLAIIFLPLILLRTKKIKVTYEK